MKVKITADSVCDLSPEQRERYGLNVLPLYVMLDGKEHRDGVDIIPEDIYSHVAAGGDLGSTAALSVADRAYVLENGRIVLSGTGKELSESEMVKKAYLGG